MSALIAGIDFSAERFDAALIPLDADDGSDAPPVTLRQYELPRFPKDSSGKYLSTPAFRTVERCRVVREAMRVLVGDVPIPGDFFSKRSTGEAFYHEVVHVCVETPLGSKSRSTVLWELYGAILASIPSHIERDTILTNEWRRFFWPIARARAVTPRVAAIDWKPLAIQRAFWETGVEMDEHQAEAYLIARACRERLEAAVKGAA